jgi:hypothetical protein
MTLSENDMSEKTETGGRLFGTATLVLTFVVSGVSHETAVTVGVLNWMNVSTATPSGPSSVSRRLTREFSLGYKDGYPEYGTRIMNKKKTHIDINAQK